MPTDEELAAMSRGELEDYLDLLEEEEVRQARVERDAELAKEYAEYVPEHGWMA